MPKNFGIFGPKQSGKTTLACYIAKLYYRQKFMKAVALDRFGNTSWPANVSSTDDEESFWATVWKEKGLLVIVDDGSATIARDKTLIPVFTALRHNGHDLLVIGHSGTDLLPVMREQLDECFLFRQPRKASEIWADVFTDESLLAACELRRFEFLHARLYQESQKKILKKSVDGTFKIAKGLGA